MQALELSPLIIKELGGMARRGWTYLLRTFYVVLTALLVYGVAGPAITGGREIHTSEYAELGRRLFSAFTTLQMFFLPLASAVAASDMLHVEARRGTLPILLLTPLKPSGIVWGKWKAVLLYTSSLAFSGLPVLGVAAFLGGVGPEDLVWSLTLSLAMSGATAAMAIYYSVRDRTVVEAAIRAYLMLQLSVLPYGLVGGILTGVLGKYGMMLAAWSHPYIAWAAAANPARVGSFAAHGWIGATLTTAWWCRRNLAAAVPILQVTRHGSRFLDGPVLGGPARNEESHAVVRPGPIWEEWPLLWKECALRTVRLPQAARRWLLSLFGLLTVLAIYNRPEAAFVQLGLLLPIALVLTVAVGAGHFAREKERRSFEMLLCAPVGVGRIVGAKLLSGVLGMEVLSLLGFIAVGFLASWSKRSPSGLPLAAGSFLCFSYLLSSALSLRSGSYRTAFLSSGGVLVFLLVGLPILADLLQSSPLASSPGFRFATLVLDPLAVIRLSPEDAFGDLLLPAQLGIYAAASLALVASLLLGLRSVAAGR